MDTEEKITKAEEQKKAGNEAFKAGENKKAIKKYHTALLYLKDIENPSPLEKMSGITQTKVSDSDLFIINTLRSICYNNLAACLMKKENYDKVIQYTTKTLDVDPSNIKALFRRGQAYLNVKDIDKAEKDFLEIKDIDEKETCTERFFPLIEAERKRQVNREKDLYKKMMRFPTNVT